MPDLRAPGIRNLDMSMFKNFQPLEKLTIQFRAEAFNATNAPQFAAPNTSLASTSFGVVTSTANSPRQVQFGLKTLVLAGIFMGSGSYPAACNSTVDLVVVVAIPGDDVSKGFLHRPEGNPEFTLALAVVEAGAIALRSHEPNYLEAQK